MKSGESNGTRGAVRMISAARVGHSIVRPANDLASHDANARAYLPAATSPSTTDDDDDDDN